MLIRARGSEDNTQLNGRGEKNRVKMGRQVKERKASAETERTRGSKASELFSSLSAARHTTDAALVGAVGIAKGSLRTLVVVVVFSIHPSSAP